MKIDTNILIAQLNRTASNLSEALIICWIAWIQLFDFIMQHVSDTKHKAADELLQKSKIKRKFENDENIDNFINTQLNIVTIFTLTAENSCEEILNAEYSSEHQWIAYYLTILCRFSEITSSNFQEFKKKAFWFLVQKIHLFHQQRRNVSFKCVVNSEQMKQQILENLHKKSDHWKKKEMYQKIAQQYWWEKLYNDVKKHCYNCV